MGWGNGQWGSSPWGGGDSPGPTPVPPSGDGHIPYAAGFDQALMTGSESVQIEMSPTLDFVEAGKANWTWHFLGDPIGLSAGKTLTLRIRRCPQVALPLASCPVVGTVTVTANGPFHVQFTSAIPALGSACYLMTRETDSLTPCTLRGFLMVAEVFD